ncbi:hypothetical protein QBC46DRAFT_399677 [Diplogelasinospora grovesii]|uniref:Uncharacterized protein n=1 Tax=Diplogelasinospora grovesii TaxID=303347 RepID=A0AAN6MXV5_9PEZI|nr:hypothetical protein QBC46DRAFT_399677 [Diplogelasinospora grovesii]
MASANETLQEIQRILGPYIRPREEAAQIRRILALHLDTCLKDGSASGPLALVESNDTSASPTSGAARGLRAEYLEALNAHAKAQSEHRAALARAASRSHSGAKGASPPTGSLKSDLLQDKLTTIKIQQKQEKLQAVEKYLGLLRQKPAASPAFLLPEDIFGDSLPLPDVPHELLTCLALDSTTAGGGQLKDLIDQLEKHVLRAKLLLQREEQLLEQVKARYSARPENVTASVKFAALDATRGELINWIETELGKASGDGAEDDHDHHQGTSNGVSKEKMDEELANIKGKYSRYLEARKNLLQLVSQQVQPVIKPQAQSEDEKPGSEAIAATPTPPAHLLTPYLEELLAVAHEQKGLITQKSHLNTTITKQLKESCQTLDHLAEESQLIPSHPMPGAAAGHKRAASFADAVAASSAENNSLEAVVKPWVYAADSAKIATLEAIAEKIDEGQVALEGSARALAEIDQLLGKHLLKQQGNDEGKGDAAGKDENDIWLADGESQGRGKGKGRFGFREHTTTRKEDKRKSQSRAAAAAAAAAATDRDVWSILDGNLGLLRSDSDPF